MFGKGKASKSSDSEIIIRKLQEEIEQLKNIVNDLEKLKIQESNIDNLIYHLYGLTYDEVLIVDPETPMTREEYESKK